MVDLNSLIDPLSGWVYKVDGINDAQSQDAGSRPDRGSATPVTSSRRASHAVLADRSAVPESAISATGDSVGRPDSLACRVRESAMTV